MNFHFSCTSYVLSAFLTHALCTLSHSDSNLYPSSCYGLEDGYYLFQLIDDTSYPPIWAQCVNNFMIIDYSLDSDISKYFTSWTPWYSHHYGPSANHHVNWQDWYIPSLLSYKELNSVLNNDENDDPQDTTSDGDVTIDETNGFEWLTSPNCNECDFAQDQNYYDTQSTYWLSGNLYGCFWQLKGTSTFEEDWQTEECAYYHHDFDMESSQSTSSSSSLSSLSSSITSLGNIVGDAGDSDRHLIGDYDKESATEAYGTGTCGHSVHPATNKVYSNHRACWDDYNGDDGNLIQQFKPSLGTNGKYCVCVKPTQGKGGYYEADADLAKLKETRFDALLKRKENIVSNRNNNNKNNDQRNGNVDSDIMMGDDGINENSESENDKSGNEKFSRVFYLSQNNFERGTYRITQPGTYVITEDIVFDFASNEESPNSEGAYWPSDEDSEVYPGAGSYSGAYSQGWFAGITVECDDVLIDLNDKELRMSNVFYYQQRWFTIIEISNQYFITGQGNFNAGPKPLYTNNIEIRNGVIGLSSHHGIHSNFVSDLLIQNIKVKHFETHGIQLNGFENVQMTDVEVGPGSRQAKLNGNYAHGRGNIARYRAVAEDYPDNQLKFFGRDSAVTMSDIVHEMELQLDFALNYVLHGTTLSDPNHEHYSSFISALNTFVFNEDDSNANQRNGEPFGASQYGIFLNGMGVGTLTYNLDISTDVKSHNAILENIQIHGLRHNMWARHALVQSAQLMNSLGMVMDAGDIFANFNDWENDELGFTYKGNIITDAALFLDEISNDFDYLGSTHVKYLTDFALGYGMNLEKFSELEINCNSDIMFHSGKGLNGLRIDGVESVSVKNINIYNNHELTDIENTNCNSRKSENYDVCMYTNDYDDKNTNDCGNTALNIAQNIGVAIRPHGLQLAPMQNGFSGNMNHGIAINTATDVTFENVYISDLSSRTGHVFGIAVYPNNEVKLKGDIIVDNLNAGYDVDSGLFYYGEEPNSAAEVCALKFFDEYNGDGGTYYGVVDVSEQGLRFETKCMQGHVGCFGSDTSGQYFNMFSDDIGQCDSSNDDDSYSGSGVGISNKDEYGASGSGSGSGSGSASGVYYGAGHVDGNDNENEFSDDIDGIMSDEGLIGDLDGNIEHSSENVWNKILDFIEKYGFMVGIIVICVVASCVFVSKLRDNADNQYSKIGSEYSNRVTDYTGLLA